MSPFWIRVTRTLFYSDNTQPGHALIGILGDPILFRTLPHRTAAANVCEGLGGREAQVTISSDKVYFGIALYNDPVFNNILYHIAHVSWKMTKCASQ